VQLAWHHLQGHVVGDAQSAEILVLDLGEEAPALGEVALLFGPADYCALMMVGFVCVSPKLIIPCPEGRKP
jgi:TctA family transporter